MGVSSLGTISIKQVSLNDVSKQILAPNCKQLEKQEELDNIQFTDIRYTDAVTTNIRYTDAVTTHTNKNKIFLKGNVKTSKNQTDEPTSDVKI